MALHANVGGGNLGPIPGLLLWTIVAVAIGWVVLNKTRFGRQVLATGGNRVAAAYSGVNTGRITFTVMLVSSVVAAIAGMLYAGRLESGRYQWGTGDELSVIAYGSAVHLAMAAADELGESVEVLDLRTLAPLDTEAILATARKTGKVLIAHEATQSCGVGAEVAALVAAQAFEHLDAPVRRLTAPDVPIPFSPPLEQAVLPQPDDMKEAINELLSY